MPSAEKSADMRSSISLRNGQTGSTRNVVADSGIVMVDGCFMVDRPCVNHAGKAVNVVLWLMGVLGRWLTEACLISNLELSGYQFSTIFKSNALIFQSASI